jgi:hypothetical protein
MALTAKEVEARRKVIGASDVPIILGLSKHMTARQLYAEKQSKLPAEVPADNEASLWGQRLEPILVEEWGKRMGYMVWSWHWYRAKKEAGELRERYAPLNTVHPDIPWATCTPDGVVPFTSAWWGVEAKNRAYETGWGPSGTAEIPLDVEAQVRWSMFVTGCDHWGVAVLLGGNQFRHYLLARDESWEELVFPIIEAFRAGEFYEEPAAVWIGAYEAAATRGKIPATDEQAKLMREYRAACDVAKRLEESIQADRKKLFDIIGSEAGLYGPDIIASVKVTKVTPKVDWKSVVSELSLSAGAEMTAKAISKWTKPATMFRSLTVRPVIRAATPVTPSSEESEQER